jgi:hypothetical protein
MSWAVHYAIRLERELAPEEVAALTRLSEQHRFSLEQVVRGVGRMREWKGLIPDEELERLEKLHAGAQARRPADAWDFRGFISLSSVGQLCRVIAWLREVEALLPVATFTVKEDHSITHACRPSEVDLDALREQASAEPEVGEEDDETDPGDEEVEELVDEGLAERARVLWDSLEGARRDFEFWKKSQLKKP